MQNPQKGAHYSTSVIELSFSVNSNITMFSCVRFQGMEVIVHRVLSRVECLRRYNEPPPMKYRVRLLLENPSLTCSGSSVDTPEVTNLLACWHCARGMWQRDDIFPHRIRPHALFIQGLSTTTNQCVWFSTFRS